MVTIWPAFVPARIRTTTTRIEDQRRLQTAGHASLYGLYGGGAARGERRPARRLSGSLNA
jgi:hypothetical protein